MEKKPFYHHKNRGTPGEGKEKSGLPWTQIEEDQLLQELSKHMDLEQIAQAHKRTQGGITTRVKIIALKLVQSGSTIDEVIAKTHLTHAQVEKIIKKHTNPDEQSVTSSLENLSIQPEHEYYNIEIGPDEATPERLFQKHLNKLLNGKMEESTCYGIIDILTLDSIIEVKKSDQWKHAMGQILAYGEDPKYANHKKKLALYREGYQTDQTINSCIDRDAYRVCSKFQVTIIWLFYHRKGQRPAQPIPAGNVSPPKQQISPPQSPQPTSQLSPPAPQSTPTPQNKPPQEAPPFAKFVQFTKDEVTDLFINIIPSLFK